MVGLPNPPDPLPPPHTRLGVGGVLLLDGKVLVNRAVYRERFTIPSGYVEVGEEPEQAVVREFQEETGVEVRVGSLLLVRHRVVGPHESDVYLAFRLEYRAGEPAAKPPEIAEIRLVPLEAVAEAHWISSLSRLAVRLALTPGWPRSAWRGADVPASPAVAYHRSLEEEDARAPPSDG
ncbi:MAG TPA: NUDIX hydrolase [Thermoplasmata archaeon]|nr:NUDIX hydrolase [Thermoplasmata archaeon]